MTHGVSQLFETGLFAGTLGTVRLTQWPEGLVLWCGGQIVWRSWTVSEKPMPYVLGALVAIEAISSGSTTANSLPHINKIARAVIAKSEGSQS